jgi:ribonuclease P protein component
MISDGKFRKREHILKSKDFRAVYRKGLSVRNGPLVLCWLPNGLAHSRIGFSISSSNIKRAVRRNRARRLFREAYRKHRSGIRTPVDLVLVVKRNMPEDMKYGDAEQALLKAMKRAGLLI